MHMNVSGIDFATFYDFWLDFGTVSIVWHSLLLIWLCVLGYSLDQKNLLPIRHVTSTQIYYPDSEPTIAREATNSNFIVFGSSRTGFQPTIHCTRGEYANYIVLNHWSGFSILNTKFFFLRISIDHSCISLHGTWSFIGVSLEN